MADPLIVPWKKDHGPTDYTGSFITPPKVIYRYLAPNRIESLITEKYLYFSMSRNFNDPFDMHIDLLDFYMSKANARAFVEMAYPHLTGKEKKEMIERTYNTPGAGDTQKAIFGEMLNTAGVCCFSESPLISLMWSHYTASHTGACLGFNIEPFSYGNQHKPLVQPVRYLDKLVSINGFDNSGRAVGHWFLSKSHIWSYEKEVRAIFLYRNEKVEFDPRCLKEVYFGCKMEESKTKELMQLLKDQDYHEVTCYQMRIDPSIFDIVPHQVDYIS